MIMEHNRVALVVLDGVGIGKKDKGDMVYAANMPTYKDMIENSFSVPIAAHGVAVGLASDDDMGNSEVGHNALGSGQIISQGAKLVDEAISTKKIYETDTWKNLVENCKKNDSKFHFIGLLSDGNVHSNINHLIDLIKNTKNTGIKKCFIHALLDGRDVPSKSAIKYVDMLENFLNEINDDDFRAQIASGGGRMVITMDRYKANWDMVKKGYDTHVHGIGRYFKNAKEAVNTFYEEGCDSDQYLPPFVIADNDKPVGKIEDNDSVVLYNFRGDRAIEISMAFDDDEFPYFDRGKRPNVMFAGMLEYDGDLKIPRKYLVNPPQITNTLTDCLVKNKCYEFAVSETQKFGHVTYFWNGNRSGKVSEEYETYKEITSDNCPFDERPWMKAGEITDEMIKAIQDKKYSFIRCNYPNGDMVGHTGNVEATRVALECVDLQLKRLREECKKNDVILVVVADHGNSDQMFDYKNQDQIRTAHSLNPVWFIIDEDKNKYSLNKNSETDDSFGLANVAATIVTLMGCEPPKEWKKPIFNKIVRKSY